MRDVAVVGLGRTAYTLRSGRTTLSLATEAVRSALADAGLAAAEVDGMITFGCNDTSATMTVSSAVGIDELTWGIDLFGGGNLTNAMVSLAADAIAADTVETVVLYRSLNGRSGQRFGDALDVMGRLSPDMPFNMPQGYIVPPQFMAMWAQRHQHEYGSTCEDLGQIAITQRSHAVTNPHAIAREPLDMAGYLAGRWINEPLRVYDCAFEVDGACAMVLTTMERARDLRAVPVRIAGSVNSTAFGGSWDQWPDPTSMFSRAVAPRLMKRVAGEIGSVADFDVACIYDCFTYTVMAVMEDFGFFDKGAAGEFFAGGRATYGGDVVVNPHGGLLSEGYLHGLNTHYEAVAQLRGEATTRQVAGAEVALATAGAGPYGGGAVYLREAR